MNSLVFYSSKNSDGKTDASGAFVPEAKSFAKRHNIPVCDVIGVDCTKRNSPGKRREVVMDEIAKRSNLDLLAFFGHGWPDGIQFGLKRIHVQYLVKVIGMHSNPGLKVGLFACLTAENDVREADHRNVGPGTDNGFADCFRDEMVRCGMSGGWVDAHKTAGHTNWNPYVVRFMCEDVKDPQYGAEGGSWLVSPGSLYWKRWCRALKNKATFFRYDFMLMDELEIMEALAGMEKEG